MSSTRSKNGNEIRLSEERWKHISDGHPEMKARKEEVKEAILNPDLVVDGDLDELIAVKTIPGGSQLRVVYREIGKTDGFVITAYVAKTSRGIEKRNQRWP